MENGGDVIPPSGGNGNSGKPSSNHGSGGIGGGNTMPPTEVQTPTENEATYGKYKHKLNGHRAEKENA